MKNFGREGGKGPNPLYAGNYNKSPSWVTTRNIGTFLLPSLLSFPLAYVTYYLLSLPTYLQNVNHTTI